MTAARVRCLGCGLIGRWGRAGRCEECRRPIATARERDLRRRGIKRARYDADHRRIRRAWLPYVLEGIVRCGRCAELIDVGEPWDLDHLPTGRQHPSHASCNRKARRTNQGENHAHQ